MTTPLAELGKRIAGEVLDDVFTRHIYSIDASLYRIEPMGVLFPKSIDDIMAGIEWARQEGVAVVPRGAATGITGGCLGAGLVIDCSKYLRGIGEADLEAGTVVCQPGVVQDQLNAYLAPHGYRFGPDTSTGNRATLGGMVGNNSSGAHSLRYGKTVDNIVGVEAILADGSAVHLGEVADDELQRLAAAAGAEGGIYRAVNRLRGELEDEVAARFPKLERRVSGYNLDELFKPGPLNLAKLFVGSEGTFGLATQIECKIVPRPAATAVCVLHFADLLVGLDATEFLLDFDPFALELIDRHIIEGGRASPMLRGKLDWLRGDPDGLLAAEFEGDSAAELTAKLERFEAAVRREGMCYELVRLEDQGQIANVWALRKAGLGLVMSRRTSRKAIAFLEDIAVPPGRIGEFTREFREYARGLGRDTAIYGHAGAGCLHFRPAIDLKQGADLELMTRMFNDVSDMLLSYGGTLSGEHGDGLVRSWLNEKMFGPVIYQAFKDLKAAFDPDNRMNPGKIVADQRVDENLRVGPATKTQPVETFLSFADEGGFAFALEMCNGNAQCRQPGGAMCPSFQVTGDERHGTRGRAASLQAVVHGDVGLDEFGGRDLYDVLDLCLQCKSCKRECPSQVDMAKFKAEFLYQYQQRRGVPWRSRVFAEFDRLGRLGSMLAPLSNWLAQSGPGKWGLERLGIDARRQLPPFARLTFSAWYRRRPRPAPPEGGAKVLLFIDCYTEYNYPRLGQDAVKVLEALGCNVVAARLGCCGRPAISKGLLETARGKLERLTAGLLPYVDDGFKIVGLEPSCVGVLTDDAKGLAPGETTERIASAVMPIDDFLAGMITGGILPASFRESGPLPVHVHCHCHQRALSGNDATLATLRATPGLVVHEIDAGCCGMAGAFGYEAEHYEFSMQVGADRLFPALRELADGAVIVADGVSCRSQIEHGVGLAPLHLVELLAKRL